MKKIWFGFSYQAFAGISWALLAISLLLPAVKISQDLLGGTYLGWQITGLTFLLACFLDWGALLLTGCNVLMLLSPFLLRLAAKRRSYVPAILMFVAVLSVFTPIFWDERMELLPGYYFWCSSFILAAIALLIAARNSARQTFTVTEENYQGTY